MQASYRAVSDTCKHLTVLCLTHASTLLCCVKYMQGLYCAVSGTCRNLTALCQVQYASVLPRVSFCRSGMMLLNITVGDENDNSPVFQQPLYTVRVPESAEPGIMLTRVRAMDRDSGGNGLIKYMISPRTSRRIQNSFEMNAETGAQL